MHGTGQRKSGGTTQELVKWQNPGSRHAPQCWVQACGVCLAGRQANERVVQMRQNGQNALCGRAAPLNRIRQKPSNGTAGRHMVQRQANELAVGKRLCVQVVNKPNQVEPQRHQSSRIAARKGRGHGQVNVVQHCGITNCWHNVPSGPENWVGEETLRYIMRSS